MSRRIVIAAGLAVVAGCLNPFDRASWNGVTGGATTAGEPVPCGANPCDDGQGDQLQDVGEACSWDDDTGPGPLGGPACCHGLTCQGATSSTMGTCARPSTAGSTGTCPNLWLYQCDGLFTTRPASDTVLQKTLQFTGPPAKSQTWMKIAFAANFPQILDHGVTYYYLAAKNCMALGPYVP